MQNDGSETVTLKRTELEGKRKAFRAALALAGLTQTKWAELEGITQEHVSLVLSGKRDSARLIEKIDAFIAKHLQVTA
jgi:predicted transcriptional regulator